MGTDLGKRATPCRRQSRDVLLASQQVFPARCCQKLQQDWHFRLAERGEEEEGGRGAGGGREGSRMKVERRRTERSTRLSGRSENRRIPMQLCSCPSPSLQEQGPAACQARTVRWVPSAGRGSGWRAGRRGAQSPSLACARPAGSPGRAPLDRGAPALPELARLAVHTGQQQPGRLADVVAVHGEAAAVAGVRHGHPDPLHQRRQHEEGPARENPRELGRPGGGGCRLSPTPSSRVPPPSRAPSPASPTFSPLPSAPGTLPLISRMVGEPSETS